MRLYDITANVREIMDNADDGELTPELLAALDALELQRDAKIDGCCGLIAEWQSVIAAKQAEIDRLRAGMETKKNNIQSLKKYVQESLETLGERKHETALWTVYVQKNPPSVSFDGDPSRLPFELQRVKIEANNAAALDQFKLTGSAPPGFVVTQGSHLRIK